jgi:fibronectin-binding autotransporter adhesin
MRIIINPAQNTFFSKWGMDRMIQIVLVILSLCYSFAVCAQQCDITITTSATSNGSFSGTAPNRTFTPTASASTANIQASALITELASNSVTINTANTSGGGSGNVTFSTAVTSASTSTTQRTFTINAGGSITVSAAINLTPATPGGNSAGNPASHLSFNSVNDITVNASMLTVGGNANGNGNRAAGISGNITLISSAGSIKCTSTLNASGGNGVGNGGNRDGSNITLNAASGITLSGNLTSDIGATGGGSPTKGDVFLTNGATTVTSGGTNDGQTAGVISCENLTKSGSGILMMAGTNTYTGTTTISSGKLGASATVTASTNGPFGNNSSGLILNGGTILSNTATFSRPITVSANSSGIDAYGSARTISSTITGTGAFSLIVGGTTAASAEGQNLTLSNTISSSGALTLTKTGTSTVILSGTNTYTGSTTVNGGILRANTTNIIASTNGPFGNNASNLNLAGGTIQSNVTTFSRPITVTATGSGLDAYGSSRTISSTITGTGAFNLTVGGTTAASAEGQNLTLSGVIGSSGALTLTKIGTSTVVLSASNTYTGVTTVSAGTLKIGANGGGTNTPLGTAAAGTIVASGAVLDLNGFTLGTAEGLTLNGTGLTSAPAGALTNTGTNASYSGAIILGAATTITATSSGSLTCSGTINSGAFDLTLDGGSSSNGTFSGIISSPTSITKNGSGQWTLSGANTYTGPTTINGGKLAAGISTNAFGANSAVTLANTSGVILDITGFDNTVGSLTGGGGSGGNVMLGAATLTIGTDNSSPAAFAGIISGTGSITKDGTGDLILSGANTFTGTTTIAYGIIKLGVSSSSSTSGPLGAASTGTVLTSGNATLDLNGSSLTGAATEPLTIRGTGISSIGAITNTGANATLIGDITLSNTATIEATTSGTLTLLGDISGNKKLTIRGLGDGIISGVISLTSDLTKNDNGSWLLSGNNTYTGITTISKGTLKLGSSSSSATSGPLGIAASNLELVGKNSTLDLNGFSLTGAAGKPTILSGTGISNTGALTNTGGNAIFTGSITLSTPTTIQTTTSGTLTIEGTIAVDTFMIVAGDGQGIINSIISGSYDITKNNPGSWTLSGTNSYTGGTTLNAGTLNINNASALGASGTFTISGGSINNTTGGSITTNNYTLDLSGDFTFVGTQNLNLGTGSVTMSADRQITITANTLTFGGTLSQATRSLTKLGAGTLSFGSNAVSLNNLTLTAGTIVSTSGTLSIAGNFTNSGTFTHNSGTVNYTATGGGQTVAGVSYSALTLSNTTGTQTLAAATTVGGVLTLSGGKLALGSNTLTLNGTLSGMTASSSFTANGSSSLVVNGSGALGTNLFLDQTTPGTTNRLTNFTYNRSSDTITLGDTMEVTGAVTPTAGTLATGNVLKLVSNASGTARMAAGSGSYISGNVIAERFIPSIARRWRFMGSPISSGTLADWQNEIYITGAGGATNGFDATLSNQASVYSYDETVITGDLNTGYVAASNTSNALTVGKGFRVFIRGDRSDTGRLVGTTTSQNAVTLNLIGPLNTGNITLPVSFTSSGNIANDGWCLVANPYASAFDWNAFYDAQNGSGNCTNIDPTIYIYDANSNGYKSYNAVSNSGTLTGGTISSGSAFWVKATAATPALILSETFKTASVPVGLFKTNEGEGFKIRVEADSISYDEMVVKYVTGSTVNKDVYDIRKLPAIWVNICAYGSDTQYLSATVRPPVNTNDTIRLGVYASTTGNYKLRFYNSDEIAIQENVLLYDTYTATVTDLLTTNEYNFAVTSSIAATQGDNRFYIVVANNTGLPVSLLTFGAVANQNKTVNVNWSTIQELNNDHFEVERSVDGLHFQSLGSVQGKGNAQKLNQYRFVDNAPTRINYYRLKQVDMDGTIHYSKIVRVNMDQDTKVELSLFPVPAKTYLTVSQQTIIQSIKVYDMDGLLQITQSANANQVSVTIENLSPGVYIIEVQDENGQVVKEKFVKE